MDKLRLRFEKTGRAVYISHLDLMTTMQRAFSRAGLELKYSEGFNPHPLISILLPLSVGTASVCELMDFRMRGETSEELLQMLPEKITAVMPEGIRVIEAYPAERKGAQLKWLDVQGSLEFDHGAPAPQKLQAFFAQKELIIERKTKRGLGFSDIRPAINRIDFAAGDPEGKEKPVGQNQTGEEPAVITLRARISAQEPTLNPDHLISALRQLRPELAPDFAEFTRLETYDAEQNIFR